MSSIISARGLTKQYEGTTTAALSGVDLDVAEGEFVAIMGPSASGKSTLLNLVAGLDVPTSGEVHLAGTRIDDLTERDRAIARRNAIGFVFQSFNLISSMTVAENVALAAQVAGIPSGRARTRTADLLEQLDLAAKAGASPSGLSGGEQQRTAIARAMVNEPAVLVADEPTGNLDTDSARDVIRLLADRNAAGQTILLVTHDPRVAAAADRVLQLRDGQIQDEARLGTTADAREVLTRLVDLEF